MHQLIFATNNQHKVEEINFMVGSMYNIISLEDAGIDIDIPEPYNTIEANASIKSKTIYELTGRNCFSEDTGLEVDALNGEPGVKSARYSGRRDSSANIDKLLQNLEGKNNRNARFKTVISLIMEGNEYLFEGICNGIITSALQGTNGFGYDPIFVPAGALQTFGQMSLEEKNIYSHRAKATSQLSSFLSHYWKNPSL